MNYEKINQGTAERLKSLIANQEMAQDNLEFGYAKYWETFIEGFIEALDCVYGTDEVDRVLKEIKT